MIDQNRTPLRASARIRDRLLETHREVPEIAIPDAAWQECQRIARGIAKAHQHGWHWAVRHLRGQLAYAIGICRRRLEEAQWQFDAAGPDTAILTQRDVFSDLLVLDKEFDEVRIDLKRGMLSVVTEEIALEGIALGRFEIMLDWNLLGGSLAYEVVALDPNPAASSSDTTHPHV